MTKRSEGVSVDQFGVSVVAVPKPFRGHIGIIQENALSSWKQLGIVREITLLGNEEGVRSIAESMVVGHYNKLRSDSFGTPLVDDVFRVAQKAAKEEWLCYVNADIILMPEFSQAVLNTVRALGKCLIVSRRWNLKVKQRLDFNDDWRQRLNTIAADSAELFSPYGIDVFVFPKELYNHVPPFSLGRSCWDNWLILEARRKGYPVVDVTEKFSVIHQDHSYDGFASIDEIRRSQQGLRNFWLAGDSFFGMANTNDATHVMKDGDIVPISTKTVSVVVPHAGNLAQVRRCLQCLSHQSYPRTYIEIIIVDNSDQSVSAPLLAEFPYVKLTREIKPGPAAARNKGAAIAQGDIIAFLDSDCRPTGKWIEKAVAVAAHHDFKSIVACNIKPSMSRSGAEGVKWYEAITFHEQKAYVEIANACITGGMMVPSSIWNDVGHFDEDFTEAACEDWEWSTRATSRGFKIVYAADSVVAHPVHNKWYQLKEKARRLARGELRLEQKRGSRNLMSVRSMCAAYTKRFVREMLGALRNPTVPLSVKPMVAFAAGYVWFWSIFETRRQLNLNRNRRRFRVTQ